MLNAVPEEKLLGYSQPHLSRGFTFTLELDNLFLQHTTYFCSTLLWASNDKTSARATRELAFLPAPQVFPPPSKELAGTQSIRAKPDLT